MNPEPISQYTFLKRSGLFRDALTGYVSGGGQDFNPLQTKLLQSKLSD